MQTPMCKQKTLAADRVDLVRNLRVAAAFAALEGQFAAATSSRLDGLRLDWPDQWLLIRASNTEPLVRLIAEAKDPAAAEQHCRQAAAIARSR